MPQVTIDITVSGSIISFETTVTSVGSYAQESAAIDEPFKLDKTLTKVDVVINGKQYKSVPCTYYGFANALCIGEYDMDNNYPVFDKYPFTIIFVYTEDDATDIVINTPQEGDYAFEINVKPIEDRVMKLHGASRTYSHTVEPRLVKQSSEVKDWPIKDESFSKSYDVTLVDEGYIEGLEFDLDPTNISSWKVSVNGLELEWHDDGDIGYFYDENNELYEFGYSADEPEGYWLWAYENGTYKLDIIVGQKVIDSTFAEAVEMVTKLPKIEAGDAGKAIIVNEAENGFILGETGGETHTQIYHYTINNIASTTIYAHSRNYVTLQFLSVDGITPEMINQYLDVGGIEHNSNCCICSYTAKFIENNVNVYVYLYNPTDNDITFSPGEVWALLYSKYMIEPLD